MDILLAVGFLCTRVSKSTTEDEGKLNTWADVVKFPSPQQVLNRNKIVSGSFSRNNPDCKTKV